MSWIFYEQLIFFPVWVDCDLGTQAFLRGINQVNNDQMANVLCL